MLDWKEHIRLTKMTEARKIAVKAAEYAEFCERKKLEEKKRKEDFKFKLAIPWYLQSNNKCTESNIYRCNLISCINKSYNNYKKSTKINKKEIEVYLYRTLKKTISFVVCFTWLIGFINMNKNASLFEYILALFNVFMVMFFVNYHEN